MALDSMKEIFERSARENIPFWEIVLQYDMEERQVSRQASMAKMLSTWQAIQDAADSYTGTQRSVSGLVGGDGLKMRLYARRGESIGGEFMDEVIVQAISMAESNACMRRIVASPTAGSCGVVPAVRLTEIFRQAQESLIVMNAHRVNSGVMPDLKTVTSDFFFLRRRTEEAVASTIGDLCRTRLPDRMGIPPEEIQVLSPTRKGPTGTASLNLLLQAQLNPPAPDKKEKKWGDFSFREGDRVMQIRNNYDIVWCKGGDTAAIMAGEMAPGSAPETGTGIFNGDLGTILRIDTENELIWIDFDEKLAWYGFEQLGELDHAFAVTVHKAQGSEYRAVVLAAGRAPARLLSRDLLYTAVTRARELLVVVGETAIVQAMIENGRKTRRYSGLRARLAGEV